ncbi:MAG: ribosome maturation factor RimP [Blastocatellia bacterium]
MSNQGIVDKINGIAAEISNRMGFEFVHADAVGPKRNPVIRIFIDKPNGVTIEDCAEFSREAEAVLDSDDFVPTSYTLEVSSPGLDRELYSIGDFKRFAGRKAKVKTKSPLNGQSNFNGTIMSVADNVIGFEDRSSGAVEIDYSLVEKANLKVDLEQEFKKRRNA